MTRTCRLSQRQVVPKKIDLRTYIALEKAFVRRLQRSWRIQSASTYAAIAKACTEHHWDEARRLVTDLDMTEVGTQNREWITYMLLSCAVFGANMVAKGKPSFVGVGSFDTFLKQSTNNMLMYLEHTGTRRVQEEALQSIAEDEAKTKALKREYVRDEEGQFAETGKTKIAESYDGYQHTLKMTTLDGKEIGSLKLRMDRTNKLAEFDILHIDPEARGRGYGEHLFRAAADKAKALGATRILGDVTSAGMLRLATKVMGQPEFIADAIEEFTYDQALKKLEPLAPENAEGVIDTWNYLAVRWPLKKKKYARKADVVLKWDEAEHPRDKEGRFAGGSVQGFTQHEVERQIKRIVRQQEYAHYGVRIDNNPTLAVGQSMPVSKDWSDPDHPVELKGASVFAVNDWVHTIDYSGSKIVLLGSHEAPVTGTDRVEIVLPGATVLAVWPMADEFWVPKKLAKDTFNEAEHPREPGGTPEGGRFAESGRAGEATPDPVLAQQAEAGIKAVERLLPEAIDTADYTDVPGMEAQSWNDVDDDIQDKVREKWFESAWENGVDVDTSYLDKEVRKEVQRDNDAILKDAKKETIERIENVKPFKDLEPTLNVPLGTDTEIGHEKDQFHLFRELDPDTFDYGDGEHDDDENTVALDLEALRFKSGEPLTPEEQQTVQDIWDEHYKEAYDQALTDAFESDSYSERRNEAEQEALEQEWQDMDSSDKLGLVSQYGLSSSGAVEHGEPDRWVTGVAKGEKSDEDYGQTHAIAKQLTELRMDELREERGLTKPIERPKYTITETEEGYIVKEASPIKGKSPYGGVIFTAPTEEEAKHQGELWADRKVKEPPLASSTIVIQVWDQWKRSSSVGLSMSLQLAASKELGGVHRMTPEEVQQAEEDAIPYGGIPTLQAYVRAQWEVTQMVMKKAGESKIDVYRALMLPGDQVMATHQEYWDREGRKKLDPPTNIKVVEGNADWKGPSGEQHPWPTLPSVTFDFNGEHFEVGRQRVPLPNTWKEVDEDIKKKVMEHWEANVRAVIAENQADVREGKYTFEKGMSLFEGLGDKGKLQNLKDWQASGKVPPQPLESIETAIQRRLDDYKDTHRSNLYVRLPVLQLQRAGAQSTTGTSSVANGWGGVGNLPKNPTRVVVRIEAPPTSVLSLPVYGDNDQAEHETVVLGTKDKWLWDAWLRLAPEYSATPITQKADMKPLVIDLQAEDRGKPHWMSSVDWEKLGKPSYSDVLKYDPGQPRDPDGRFAGYGFSRVALTSQRSEGDPGHQSNKEVFRHMREFDAKLKALPGVSRVSVKPGVGGWEGGSESMWQIYYKGNGAARKLVAQTAKTFNQDAVLVLKKCGGKDCQPAVELSFQGAVSPAIRETVHKVLVKNGIGGWTWMKRNGKTLLRMVSVPQWGGEAAKHQAATAAVSKKLREDGLENHRTVHKVAVSVMEREGVNSYDTIIGA